MKRFPIILAVLMLAVSLLAACGVTNDLPYTAGTLDADGYTSEWLGLSFTKADNIVMSTKEEIQELQTDSGTDAESDTVYEMLATDSETFSSVLIMVQKTDGQRTSLSYIEDMKTELEAQLGSELTDVDITEKKLAGAKYTCFEYSLDAYGVPLSQTMLVRKLADRIVTICFTYSTDAELDAFIGCFKAYR